MRITIDAGHRNNANDFGATGIGGIRESEVALRIAKALESKLKSLGHQVCMTRNGENETIGIDQRTRVARNFKSDWLISIHLNAFAQPTATGVEVLYKNHHDKAVKLSNLIAQKTGLRNRGAKVRSDLGVLNGFTNSLLLECGFITNPNDLKVINNSNFDDKIAESVIETLGIERPTPIISKPIEKVEFKIEKTRIMLNGLVREVDSVNKDGNNFVKLRDLQDSKISISYRDGKIMLNETVVDGSSLNINGHNFVKLRDLPLRTYYDNGIRMPVVSI